MSYIKAAIFDLDGVIVDTAKYHYLAWRELAESLKFEFTERENERLKGVSRMKSLEILLEIGGLDFDEKAKIEMAECKNKRYVRYISRISPSEILPGALEFITDIKNHGIKTALASASSNAAVILERLNIAALFDTVVDGTSVKKAKPDPDVFLEAAGRLNIQPDRCVVFEDAVAGIEAALRAGMYAVGIGSEDILKEAGQTIKGFDDAEIDNVYKIFDIKRDIANLSEQ